MPVALQFKPSIGLHEHHNIKRLVMESLKGQILDRFTSICIAMQMIPSYICRFNLTKADQLVQGIIEVSLRSRGAERPSHIQPWPGFIFHMCRKNICAFK